MSALGSDKDSIWKNYTGNAHFISETDLQDKPVLVSKLNPLSREAVETLRLENSLYKKLDDSVLFALLTSRKAIADAGWNSGSHFGINIGSSRGATKLFETYHHNYTQQGFAQTLSSPTTTLGNISSWVAHDLNSKGPDISHSITCSTALHAMLNGIAWIQSGMCDKFLAGGSEAPLTGFTVAQMQALKIYAQTDDDFPCRALDLTKKHNGMVLGEGAAVCCLESGNQKGLVRIKGIGYATEILEHSASLSTEAHCFHRSMQMALEGYDPDDIDVIITHTPGTVKGDLSEYNAIKKVFGNTVPALTTNKWKLGHTLGASGLLSVELAILMLEHQEFIGIPYLKQNPPEHIEKIMINAVGFGGNAVSIILEKNDC